MKTRFAVAGAAVLAAAVGVALLVGSSAASGSKQAQSPNTASGASAGTKMSKSGTPVTFATTIIGNADTIARYNVAVSGKVKLSWESADAGAVGDGWGLLYIDGATGKVTSAKKCSTAYSAGGSATDKFSKMMQAQVQTTGGILIDYYCFGTNLFPADHWLRYTPNKNGITITLTPA